MRQVTGKHRIDFTEEQRARLAVAGKALNQMPTETRRTPELLLPGSRTTAARDFLDIKGRDCRCSSLHRLDLVDRRTILTPMAMVGPQ
jgi:hypothetical protein